MSGEPELPLPPDPMRVEIQHMLKLQETLRNSTTFDGSHEFLMDWWIGNGMVDRDEGELPLPEDLKRAALHRSGPFLPYDLTLADKWFWGHAERLRLGGYRVERRDAPVQLDIEPTPLFRVSVSVSSYSPAWKGMGSSGYAGEGHATASALCGAVLAVEIGARVNTLRRREGYRS